MDRFRAMQVFVDAVEIGSLTAAATKLDISRAMATRYIAALEKTFGARLLHRTSRSLGLTSVGVAVLPYCRQILALNDEIAAVVSSAASAPCGLIRVASSISFGQSYLAEALARYAALYPKVSIEMVVADRPVKLVEERIDLAIQVGNTMDPSLIARLLTRCRSIVCASPEYLARHGHPVEPLELERHNCLNNTYLGKTWRFRPSGAAGDDDVVAVTVAGTFSANDVMLLLRSALSGEGIACLPDFITREHVLSGALVDLLDGYNMEEFGVYALYASRKHLPVTTRTLLDFLVGDIATARQMPRYA